MTRRGRPEPVRFVSQALHAYIDYPVALGLIAMPAILGLMPLAMGLSVAAGLAALLLTALTDHETGVFRVLPYKVHLAVDAMVGAAFVAAPVIFGLHGMDAAYFLVVGVTVLLMIAAHRPEQTVSVA